MPPDLPGQPKEAGSADGSIGEHNLQLVEHQIPVWIPGAPTFRNALRGQIEHPAQRVVIGETGLVFRDLPELTVQPLDNVRRVYDLPNFQRIFKKGAQNFPIFLPAFDTGGILAPPAFPKGQEVFPARGMRWL